MVDHVNRVLGSVVPSKTQRAVLIAFAHHANKHSIAWPSWALLQIETGFSRKSVANAISELREDGVLEVYEESDGRSSVKYRLCLQKLTWSSDVVWRGGNIGLVRDGEVPNPQELDEKIRQLPFEKDEEVVQITPQRCKPDYPRGSTDYTPEVVQITPETTTKPKSNVSASLRSARTHDLTSFEGELAKMWVVAMKERDLWGYYHAQIGKQAEKDFREDPDDCIERWQIPKRVTDKLDEKTPEFRRDLMMILIADQYAEEFAKLRRRGYADADIKKVVRYITSGAGDFDWLGKGTQAPSKLLKRTKADPNKTYFDHILKEA